MIRFLVIAAIAFGGYWFFLRGGCGTSGAIVCPPAALEEGVGTTLGVAEVCAGAGYLCVGRERGFQVLRWPLDKGRLRVRVSLPEFVDEARARELQAAAIEGIKEWDGHPFPLVVDSAKHSFRFWDINVVWSEGMNGGQAGQARVRGMPNGKRIDFDIDGLAVVVPPMMGRFGGVLAQSTERSREDLDAALLDRVRATAMHEMGHSLGLMHSDVRDDCMFAVMPENAASVHLTSRDLRTLEALYALPNGAMVQ